MSKQTLPCYAACGLQTAHIKGLLKIGNHIFCRRALNFAVLLVT
jgi:hypothetical protein